jgi:hypothetical protein
MESHVNGGITPLHLGILRRELLAVLIGNPLFTKEEQLLANHQAHECECSQRLIQWLHNVRREAERRQSIVTAQVQACRQEGSYNKEAQISELKELAQCRALNQHEKEAIYLLPMRDVSRTEAASLVGQYYVKVLRRAGKLREEYGG